MLTGATIDDLKAGTPLPTARGLTLPNPADASKAKRGNAARTPRAQQTLRPMLATTESSGALDRPTFAGDDWLFEPKLDGVRAVVHVQAGQARLVSRNGNDLTSAYPAVAAALAAPKTSGIPSFERLQQRMNLLDAGQIERADAEIPVVFFAFDLLHMDGVDLRASPLWLRKEHLVRVLNPSSLVEVLTPVLIPEGATPKRLFDSLVAQGFEGVVAKRRESAYARGKRSPQWLKFKVVHTDEFVVGGFTPGNGARASTFGALLVGRFETDGHLRYAGRVGSGFSDLLLGAIRSQLDELAAADNPFRVEPPDAKVTTFVRPTMVVELKYAEVTDGGQLRAPVFLGVRTDKDAIAVNVAAAPTEFEPEVDTSDREGTSPVLRQIEEAGSATTLSLRRSNSLGKSELAVTNLDKEMWPAHGDLPPVRKRDLLHYFAEMASFLIPHLADRPLTLTRFPNGLQGKSFYQKHWSQKRPSFVETVSIFSEDAGTDQDYLLCNNLPTLLWRGQLADLALHVSLARTAPGSDAQLPTTFSASKAAVEESLLNYPDFLLFDLDPFIAEKGSGLVEKNALTRAGFEKTAAAALWLKELLDGAGIRSFVKTSGASGIHVFVPIIRNLRYDVVRAVCSTIAGALVRAHATDLTTVFDKGARRGKVYIDVNQNGRIKSLASVYSPRANPGAPVSMPLRWDEVAEGDPLTFNIWTAADRVRASGDLWAGILEAKQDLKSLAGADPA